MTLTYVDAGILILAARGANPLSAPAIAVLADPHREFAASPFLRLEVLPQARFHRREAEVEFYETFFSAVKVWVSDVSEIVRRAEIEASTFGVPAMDALHVAAAALAGARELVTTEKPARAIHRARAVAVVTIHPQS